MWFATVNADLIAANRILNHTLVEPVKQMFVTLKSALTVPNHKWKDIYSNSNAISIFGLM